MTDLAKKTTRPVKIGILLALLTISLGFSIGIIFGGAEEIIKDVLKSNAEAVFDTVYNNDIDSMRSVLNMSGGLFKMSHIHANGLGIVSLVLIIIMMLFCPGGKLTDVASICLGAGALGYSSFWMFAGMKAPGLGSTHEATESLSLIATTSAGLLAVGLFLTFVLFVTAVFVKKNE
ncbi:MAG: hypothetical protein FVQ81_07550 [Candidatus Glassbacteria bacterium]|nr:hypothetical protein [Candidatus Glassbacteria bacterium]